MDTANTPPTAGGSPRITIAISTYNRADYLALTLASVRRQTVPPFEILIQNDGGSDRTPGVIRESGLAIREFYWENHGLAACRNHLLEEATGDWIVFLDDDDLLDDRALEVFTDALADPRERIVYSRYQRIDAAGNILPTKDKVRELPQGDGAAALFAKNFLLPSGTLLPVRALRALPELFPVGQKAEDYDLFLRLALLIPVQGIDQRLVFRRRHASNISSGNGSVGVADQIRSMEKFLALAGGRVPESVRRRRMAEMYARYALELGAEHADRGEVRRAWKTSLAHRFVFKNFIRMLLA